MANPQKKDPKEKPTEDVHSGDTTIVSDGVPARIAKPPARLPDPPPVINVPLEGITLSGDPTIDLPSLPADVNGPAQNTRSRIVNLGIPLPSPVAPDAWSSGSDTITGFPAIPPLDSTVLGLGAESVPLDLRPALPDEGEDVYARDDNAPFVDDVAVYNAALAEWLAAGAATVDDSTMSGTQCDGGAPPALGLANDAKSRKGTDEEHEYGGGD